MTTSYRKKLIEVALPLEDINREAAREKSIRHGHPSTLHLWWARRPLAACRAVLFASLVDDPSECVADLMADATKRKAAEKVLAAQRKAWEARKAVFDKAVAAGVAASSNPPPGLEPKLEDILVETERERLFDIIRELVKWENSNDERVLNKARAEIMRSCNGKPPPVYDPFCGGGSIPLEAQRLGLEAHASDLNPVPVLINKALIEIPPRFAGKPPVNPESRRQLLGTPASLPAGACCDGAAAKDGGAPSAFTPSFLPASRDTARVITSVESPEPHLGWHSRGYLPHWDHPGMIQSLGFRLHDAVPQEVIEKWRVELDLPLGPPASLPAGSSEHPPASKDAGAPSLDARRIELLKRIAKYEDASHGACYLRDPRIAELVENALLHFDGQRYRIIAWCIMPNHVHALIETWERWPLAGVLHSWKSFTASAANKILGRSGTFWFREYHDRYIRNAEHYGQAIRYIEDNPVKAGLAKLAVDWQFSSARRKAALGPPASLPAQPNPPLAGKDAGAPSSWKGAAGLAEDIRYYGQWMRDEAEKRIGHLYPKVKVVQERDGSYRHATPAEIAGNADIPVGARAKPAGTDAGGPRVQELTVIAWLWARTVASPNPAAKGAHVPLVRSFWLSTKSGKKTWVEPVVDQSTMTYRFEVRTGNGEPRAGTVGRTGGICVLTGSPMPLDYIRSEGRAGRHGVKLMAIVAEGGRGRIYLSALEHHANVAESAKPRDLPETDLPRNPRDFKTPNYGMTKHRQLFTNRQLVMLTTFCDLVSEAREKVLKDSGGDESLANAVTTYLALAVSKLADAQTSLCRWKASMDQTIATFGRQAIPMVWDFAESNAFAKMAGDFGTTLKNMMRVLVELPARGSSLVRQLSAESLLNDRTRVFSTDPPYYDNVGYADLSDFFYIWLRRCLQQVYPQLFGTVLVPKAEELIADPFRHGGKDEARSFFERGMSRVFARMRDASDPHFPTTIYYAFKQAESESDADDEADDESASRASTGWETFLQGLADAGWQIDGTWPMRTEMGNRMIAMEKNALASSIILVCRPRPKDAGVASRRDFLAALKRELPEALRNLQKGNIAPVDLAQAAIGPGMAVFSRYARVLETDGSPMGVRTALSLINQSLDEVLAEQEGEFDADTRWALAWFDQYGFTEGAYGQAETLSTAKNTSVSGMVEAGILAAKGGKVRLLKKEELPVDWNPAQDARLTVWEATHHLIRSLDSGEAVAAGLLKQLGAVAEVARDLSYRLYTVCERRKWAQEAIGYNAMVLSWPDLKRLAEEQKTAGPSQAELI